MIIRNGRRGVWLRGVRIGEEGGGYLIDDGGTIEAGGAAGGAGGVAGGVEEGVGFVGGESLVE